jgi:hypothetical protein
MKRWVSVCLKISGILLVIGIVLCIVGAGFGAVDGTRQFFREGGYAITFANVRRGLTQDASETFFGDQIKHLHMDIKYGEINIYPYEGSEIKIDTQNATNYFSYKTEGDTLSIIDQRTYRRAVTIGRAWDEDHTVINVYIPKDKVFATAIFDIGAGSMEVDSLKANELTLDVGAVEFVGRRIFTEKAADISVGVGDLQITESSINNLTLEVGAGEVAFSGTLTGDNKLSCGLGKVVAVLKGKETDYNYQIQSGIGQVRIGNKSYSGLSNRQSVNDQGDHTIHIESGVGEVFIAFEE